MRITVVIPTIGRHTLTRSIRSVLAQELKPDEILVVVDESKCRKDIVKSLIPLDKCIHIISSHGSGVSSARNTGVRYSKFELIAFLDDDDQWIQSKLRIQTDFLKSHHITPESKFVLASSAIYVGPNICFIQPETAYLESDLLRSIYKLSWKRVKTCVPTPSILLPRQLALDTPFNEKLYLREDILWLRKLESRGARIIQTSDVLVSVSYDPYRSRSNESLVALYQSFKAMSSFGIAPATKFVFGVGVRTLITKYLSRILKVHKSDKRG